MPSKSKTKLKPASGTLQTPKLSGNKKSKSKSKSLVPAVVKEAVPELPKDEEEEELEKLLFGDLEGFREGLKAAEEEVEESEDEEMRDADEAEEGDEEGLKAIEKDYAAMNDDQLFFIDDTAPTNAVVPYQEEPEKMEVDKVDESAEGKAAWVDSDDERLAISLADHGRSRKLRDNELDDVVTGREYAARLRRQFERIFPTPEWALPEKPSKRPRRGDVSESESSDDESYDFAVSAPSLTALLSSNTTLTAHKSRLRLRPEVIDIHRLPDGNIDQPSVSAIRSISFHPTHPLLLTAGFDSTLRLYHIDGKTNPAATTLHLKNTPLDTAAFLPPNGTKIVAAGRRRYFHIWNLQNSRVERVSNIYGHRDVQKSMESLTPSLDGKYLSLIGARGTVQILDANTSQWICTATIEGTVSSLAWMPPSSFSDTSSPLPQLLIANKVGEVYEFSISLKRVLRVWRDEGCVNLTTIATSTRHIAVGSASGIVNIYDRKVSFTGPGRAEDPKPVRTVESLVTSVSSLRFSPDGQVLAMASLMKKDALRLVHLPSCALYKNWPTDKTPLGKVTALEWGMGAGGLWLVVGNEAGKLRMFEVRG
ncbi:WD40 repeat-like protein [Ascodesmis nigricans]|uniref:WD40 repeat-like protein n=1 Tax=Ascodesmis nigricans TaxID=341454 RepID=A0A4V6RHI9_9PEZI|nr:WD40 repeat-like protein [Ascodesmis nigricans]